MALSRDPAGAGQCGGLITFFRITAHSVFRNLPPPGKDGYMAFAKLSPCFFPGINPRAFSPSINSR